MVAVPDFLALAQRFDLSPSMQQGIALAMLDVWNARGAADADAAVARLSTLVGWVSSEPYLHHIREAIAALDR